MLMRKIDPRLRRKPKAIIFDTDNTLYPYEPSHHAAMAAVRQKAEDQIGIKPDKFDEAFQQARAETKDRLKRTSASHSRLLYLQRMLEILGLGTQILLTLDLEQTYWRTFLGRAHLFPGVKELLADLKSEGIGTAIITDLTAQIQFRKIVYFGLESFFDYLVTSEEAGSDKPDEAPYKLAFAKLGIAPSDIWMVGDDAKADILGAHQQGMLALQKVHEGVHVSREGLSTPDFEFNDFAELRELWQQTQKD